MAKYLILIYGDERRWEARTPQERKALDEGHRAFSTAVGDGLLSGHELHDSSTATTLRSDPAGQLSATDGPFLETKEALGGYYVIEAADLDAAVALARRLPEVSDDHSGVEIRPIVGS